MTSALEERNKHEEDQDELMVEGISSRDAFLITLKAQQLADSEFKFFTAEEEAKLLHDIPILIEEGMSPKAAIRYAVLVLDVNAGENIVWNIIVPESGPYKECVFTL
jgi:uncharacterized protein YoaH (UPF0181 family)